MSYKLKGVAAIHCGKLVPAEGAPGFITKLIIDNLEGVHGLVVAEGCDHSSVCL